MTLQGAPYQVALSFEDGVTRFIECAPDQTVADASYRQRINIPLDCRDGACGTCKAFCESGEYDGGSYIDDALTADEAGRGYVLPCSMKPKSDLVLRIASTSAVAKTQAATYPATVVSLDRLSPTTVAVTLETPERDKLAFLPGQYVNIAVPGTGESRSYSFSNAPDDKHLTFLVKITPGGVMSEYLTGRARIGDELTFTGPHGSFFLRETERPVLLLAGGTGLAPILSILRTLRAAGSTRPVHLVYGVSTDDDLVEVETLTELAAGIDNFTWDHCVADPGSTARHKGYVTTLIRDEHLHGGDVAVYLCGPPPMVEAVRTHFADAGFEPTGFYYEKFALAATPPRPSPDPVVVPEPVVEQPAASRSVAGQDLFPALAVTPLRAGTPLSATAEAAVARTIAGQDIFPAPPEAGHYEIGEEHPSVHESDAVFEARQALELGAVELTIGRLDSRQLAGYRLLAESAVPCVDGDRFVDAAAYTEANAAFHDYLFTLTGNEHLLQAYRALGVKGHMETTLRDATWCHPRCTRDHLDIVTAFELGDRAAARRVIAEHADRSKQTTRRAMAAEPARPAFVTPGRFDGKVVVVTGAAQGIGERTARRIAAEGGSVVLADRSDLVAGVAGELAGEAVVADLETWEGAQAVVEAALARFGRIDVLVNNVGGAIWFKPFTEFSPAEIEAELRRSLLTTLFACRAALPSMAAGAVIVNVSSAATRGIHRIPYSAAKGGINAITASLALECADAGIRVVATAPGGTEAPARRVSRGGSALATEREQDWFQAHIDQTLESSLLKRYGTLDEQAAAIAFLASDEASYVTGTVLPVAGGDLG
ncbi:benzoate 1,2-dioxygenase electron transfer component BenC [Amycolatopsis sp. SID8362]|uniref:benzoate 1,2-dioxygenase electron transfer component BenC n=1 Tax=Amycolatopsis sp. SID8362 TaxID=2690346 RepID=UPI00136FF43F|nr:benzoate 1,2-dioxygenase electron transfer component BenC [Amycolatopsis sp. SID8362]NBH12192.1 1,6-dihydroxycyclohexa-2,4-diene-1-carboxylate dehydrogenase [Amycolatopsis sp. SID8362]NED48884.1 1,6-dihydroxycyclohexa-2,4-diene-1-carboxylate dehydrogenase [Amycolatopsis sp. SID8362]